MNILYRISTGVFPLITLRFARGYANWRIQPTEDEMRSYNQTDRVLLTFDDYADKEQIDKILHILENNHILAAFFIVGDWAAQNPDIVKKIEKAGHWIGNHTKTHANLLSLSNQQVREEILGGPSSQLLRPPYGKYDKRIRHLAKELGYKICYWDIDSDDWQGISQEEIINRVVRNVRHGSCVLLHLHSKNTIEALPGLIQEIRLKGFSFCNDKEDLAI